MGCKIMVPVHQEKVFYIGVDFPNDNFGVSPSNAAKQEQLWLAQQFLSIPHSTEI